LLGVSLGLLLEALWRGVFIDRGGGGGGNGDGWFALFRRGLGRDFVDRGFEDLDGIGEGLAGSKLTFGIPALHDLHFDSEDTLAQENVTDGVVDEVTSGLTGVDHESVSELHGLSTGGTELARNDDFATLGSRFHDETEDTIAGTTNGKTSKELVPQALALGNSRQTTVLDLLGVEFERVLGEFETLLDESGEFTDATTLLSKDFLGVGCTDDDLSAGVGHTDIATRVTFLSELTGEKLVKFSTENTIGYELSLLGNLGRHF
jgi:hypothetical protein